MVVGRHFGDRADQLRHLDLPLVVPLQAGEEHLERDGERLDTDEEDLHRGDVLR